MLKTNIDHVIRSFRGLLLPTNLPYFRDENGNTVMKGLKFWLDYRLEYEGIKRHNYIYFVICGNTSVWTQSDVDYQFLQRKVQNNTNWWNSCNHDSCWCEEGIRKVLVATYFDMASSVNHEYKKKFNKRKEIAPASMTEDIWLHGLDFATVKHRRKEDSNYLRDLVSLEPLSVWEQCCNVSLHG